MKASILGQIALGISAGYSQSTSKVASVSVTGLESASSTSIVPTVNINGTVTGTLNATAWSLIYTYPLYIFANWAGNVLRDVSANSIIHQRNLASPDSPGVIKPNVDTLYSRIVLDLSQNDVVLTIPDITDGRYWNYPVIDLFGNIIAEIGSVNGNLAGKYLIRKADDHLVQPGYTPTNASEPSNSSYQGTVDLPTAYGTMLIRFLLFENTTTDLNAIHTYQNASSLTNLTRANNVNSSLSAPPLISLAPNGTFLGIDTPAKLFNLAASLVPHNQPENYTDRCRVATTLARAGIYDGQYTPDPSTNLTLASAIANATIAADIKSPSHLRIFTNDWQLSIPSYQANYGTNYGARAYVAIAGYQQQTTRQTLYPGYKTLGFTSQITLSPNTSYLLTFNGKPQLKDTGFWSFTVYGADQYLVPNPLNRFEQGDRSFNLKYLDGSGPVYGPNSNASHDGPFQVLVQNVDNPPPANWTGNWVPGEDTFSYITRWYVPDDAMINGSYVYPKVEVIAAVTG